jgi:thiaminase/transcriptional activator TenA
MQRSFCDELKKVSNDLWSVLRNHPFVRGIGEGNLDEERFSFYLKQDYLYLIEFARILAAASAKSRSIRDICFFFDLLKATVELEMQSLRDACVSLGISLEELAGTEPGLVTIAYPSFMMRTCYDGNLDDIVAAMLPCEMGYAELGLELRKSGLPDDPYYRGWIERYSSPEYLETANEFKERLDQSARIASPDQKRRWHSLYQTALRFEVLFFEMSWRRELWPGLSSPALGNKNGNPT